LGDSQGAVSFAVLTLGVEVLHKALELFLVQVPVLVHMVLDCLDVGQEILESHVLGESHSARLQVRQLAIYSRNVLSELREGHENQQTPGKVLRRDRLALVIALVLAEVIVPELLSNFTSQLVVLLLSNCFFSFKYLFSNLFVCF
jgi:hypothetical protein